MNRPKDIRIASTENRELESFLGDRLYEFNSRTTGIDDGQLLWASVQDDAGEIVAGIWGHTWGGCCEIGKLWVHQSRRGEGIGTALMQAAEREAIARECQQIVLSTHSFQAPEFYHRLGYERVAHVADYPKDHANIILIKIVGR